VDEPIFRPQGLVQWRPDAVPPSPVDGCGVITPDVIRRAAEKVMAAFYRSNIEYVNAAEYERRYGPLRTIPAQRGANDA
jgi:hypothetical protein